MTARVKVALLSGPALDWAVAMAAGISGAIVHHGWVKIPIPNITDRHPDAGYGYKQYRPSTSWRMAGPIIEWESIATYRNHIVGKSESGADICAPADWVAGCGYSPVTYRHRFTATGPTLLVAAMRAYVMAKLGEDVEIHDKLV